MRSIAILLLLPAICAAASTPSTRPMALIVHVERVHITTDFDPATRIIPADAKRLDSIETLAQSRSEYLCAATAGGVVTELSGKLYAANDDYYRIEVDYRRKLPDGAQQVKTNLMLKPGEPLAMLWCKTEGRAVGDVVFITLELPSSSK